MSTVTTNTLIIFGILLVFTILLLLLNKGRQLKIAFTIEAGGEKKIEIYATRKWREVDIKVDGVLACTLNRDELLSGYDLTLADGSVLTFRRPGSPLNMQHLIITHNGQPLSRVVTGYDNQAAISGAASIIFMVAVINLIVGIVSMLKPVDALAMFKFGWQNIAFGVVFLALGFFAQRRSGLAMGLFILLFGLDTLPVLILSLQTRHYFVILVFLMRLVIFFPVFLGLSELFRRKAKPLSIAFSVLGIVLAVIAMLGMCSVLTWSLTNLSVSVKQLIAKYPNLLPHPAIVEGTPIETTQVEQMGETCRLRIKESAEFVNILDLADNASGKMVDYLGVKDTALVLGKDGSSPGNEWWYVEVTRNGKASRGWIPDKWVVLGEGCAQVTVIATPVP